MSGAKTPRDSLVHRIGLTGPITVAQYMGECLSHYYGTRDPFGAAGDFTTAPEISQTFGELIGLWCAVTWQRMGAPDPVRLVELGPGRGTLMADALRAAARVPAFRAALKVHLVETSPSLRDRQKKALEKAGLGEEPVWHDRFEDMPEGPLLVIANEFFDALPIHQFIKTPNGWRERLVDAADGALRFVTAPGPTPAGRLIPPNLGHAPENSVAEVSPASLSLMRGVAERVARHGGAALAIDYGHAPSACGDTLQALRRHQYHDPLADPGEADLTAHVDFAALSRAAAEAGAVPHGPVTQRDFLIRLGIEARAAALARAHPDKAESVLAGCHRLIAPEEMGTLFKVLAVVDPRQTVPAGFETEPDTANRTAP